MNYFKTCKSIDEAKKLYKELAKKHHPDKEGGDNATMQKINLEFETISKGFFYDSVNEFNKENSEFDFTEYNHILEKIIYFDDIKIEIIGKWIYIFNGYFKKEELKFLGFWFSSKHKAWIYNKEDKRKTYLTKLNTDDLRRKHGFVKVNNKQTEKLI